MSVGPLLPRRTAIALAAAGLVAVTGCDDRATPTPSATPTADPDVALVEKVIRRLRHAQHVAEAGGESELAVLHRTHIEALDGTTSEGSSPAKSAPGAVRGEEQRLQEYLEGAALAAASGALARLLASMSAAVAQRLAQGLG
ncbi:hypothetical protein [Nocardioides sp. URHA0032]|uniref:hypothetical protein n=1 Tax=Nocardioides sp. URHA0032 TaxID=1380388 RepID=UPI00048B80F9|nr:hypothetical protein [Nocardioides sp. URHA0032]